MDLDELRVEEFCSMAQLYARHKGRKETPLCKDCRWTKKALERMMRMTAESAVERKRQGGRQYEEHIPWRTLIMRVLAEVEDEEEAEGEEEEEEEEEEEDVPVKKRKEDNDGGGINNNTDDIRRGLIETDEEEEDEDPMDEDPMDEQRMDYDNRGWLEEDEEEHDPSQPSTSGLIFRN